MSDPTTSGSSPSEANAETSPTPTGSFDVPASFGTSRGTGLARGKRTSKSAPASPTPSAPSGAYQPTSIQIVTSASEYKNPFAPETPAPVEPVPTAVSPTPVAFVAPTPAPVPAPAVAPAPVPIKAAPIAVKPAAVVAAPSAPEAKAEINILPPASTRRSAESWENPSFGGGSSNANTTGQRRENTEDRPVFRSERQRTRDSAKAANPNPGPGSGFKPRERRPAFEKAPAPYVKPVVNKPLPPVAVAKPASGGLLGWLKGLFGKPAEIIPVQERPTNERPFEGGHGGNRRQRGGRGRHPGGGGGNGPRPEGRGNFEDQGPGRREGDDQQRRFEGNQEGGGRRRRRRGGRGHHGGGPRPEGRGGPGPTS